VNEDDVTRLANAIAAVQAETRQQFDALRQENAAAFDALRQENAAAHAETRRHFDISLEAARHETQLVAEGVAHLDARLTGVEVRLTRVEERLESTATETQAMIKFSHAELDRRVRSLEEDVADLQARVERLESSTH
jgi:uncharacterized protein YceH (UPF0502 family)